jgi:hypothetical protein
MGEIFYYGALFLAVLVAAWRADGGGRHLLFPGVVLYAALGFGLMLSAVHSAVPFAVGGDDLGYYQVSLRRLDGLGDWFDLRQFGIDQGGYPLLLTWVHQLVGDSLFARKALNLAMFLLLAAVWLAAGRAAGGRRLGYAFGFAILLATPLWVFWAFLLKDMSIVLLQSFFLLGMVRLAAGRVGPGTWIPIFVGTVLLVPLRIYLVLLHLAVLVATSVLLGRHSVRRKVVMLGGTALLLAGVVTLGGNVAVLQAMGATGNNRALDYESLREVSEIYAVERQGGTARMVMFPVLYVLGETAGLRTGTVVREQQGRGTSTTLRGLSAVPWIFFGTPLFAYALWRLLTGWLASWRRRRVSFAAAPAFAAAGPAGVTLPVFAATAAPAAWSLPPPAVASTPAAGGTAGTAKVRPSLAPWLPLLVYLMLYGVLAWIVSDTTRWRMPAVPVMVVLAAQGWMWLTPRGRLTLVGGWTTALGLLFTLYYVLLK